MKISIVVDDRIVSIDQCVIKMPELDWEQPCFTGEPGSVLDDVRNVYFDTERGMGVVSYQTLQTKQLTREDATLPDWKINQAQFEAMFGWVVSLHAARKSEMDAEIAKDEAAAAFLAQQPKTSAEGVDVSQFEHALADKDAELAGMRAKQADLEAKVNAMLQAAKDVGGEAA